jgi:tetratricopeptide (TPR) repeat protein
MLQGNFHLRMIGSAAFLILASLYASSSMAIDGRCVMYCNAPPTPPPPVPTPNYGGGGGSSGGDYNSAHAQGVQINDRGVALAESGKHEEAIRLFKEAIRLWPDNNIFRANLADSYGAIAWDRRDYKTALARWREANAHSSTRTLRAKIANTESAIFWQQSDWTRALAKMREAHAIEPSPRRQQAIRELEVKIASQRNNPPPGAKVQVSDTSMRDAPKSDPSKPPSTKDRESPTTLGATARASEQTPNVKTDAVAPQKVPVPRLGPDAWSRTFPDSRAPAAYQLTQDGLKRLDDARVQAGGWILDQGKEKAADTAVERIIENLPFSEAIQGGINDLSGQMKRFKALFDDKKKSAEDYVVGFFRVSSDRIKCLGSTRSECEPQTSDDMETVKNQYGNREGERWKPWIREDVSGKISVEDPRKP